MKKNYSFLSKFLHHLVLGNNILPEFLFDIEKMIFLKSEYQECKNDTHFFLSGLPRSGTTIITETLFKTGHFGSLTYGDMPFILCPNLWFNLKNKFQKNTFYNRPHTDNLKISLNSIDSFEEFFWKIKTKSSYIKKNLHNINLSNNIMNEYLKFLYLILKLRNKKYYLSKNNNNILRQHYLADFFKNSFFLIPFRNPLQQSISLLRQHINFSNIQQQDNFVLSYMNYQGHFEFGLNHKKILFNTKEKKYSDPNNINYWLNYWFNIHNYLFNKYKNNYQFIFICFENFCLDPNKFLNKMSKYINVENINKIENINIPKDKELNGFDISLVNKSLDLYQKIQNLSIC